MALELISNRTRSFVTEAREAVGGGVSFEMAWEFRTENTAAPSQTEMVAQSHAFADISGLLEDHPLRDEYLEALGITE